MQANIKGFESACTFMNPPHQLTCLFDIVPGGYLGAAMYMYTSDSNWNTLTMNTYMTSGIPVLPHTQANQLGLPSNDSSSSQLRLLNTTSFSTGTSLDVLAISIKPLAPGELVLQDET